jgi:RNA polymerase sigma-70 factor (sigma-E family)
MSVTVALLPASVHTGRPLVHTGGTLEVSVHVAPGRATPDAGPDGAVPQAGVQAGVPTAGVTADQAISELYHVHWNRLVRLATLLTRDASVAEEIVQDSFVALHRRWGKLAEHASAAAYLRTSVVNGSRSALRHRGVEERHRQPGPPEPAGPEEHAVRADADSRVMAALRTLSRRQQEVLVLRYYGDYSEQDIASTLGLSKGAVKSHAHRGLAALRDALARFDRPASGEVTR